jgi:hypothetical protein
MCYFPVWAVKAPYCEQHSRGLSGAGYDVKKSEVHGMAQRGGRCDHYFRFGKKFILR